MVVHRLADWPAVASRKKKSDGIKLPNEKEIWSEQEDPQMAAQVATAHAMKQRKLSQTRRQIAAAQVSAYEDLNLTSLDPAEYDIAAEELSSSEPGDETVEDYRQTHNLGARVMDAIDAKIFALDRVKTRIVVSDGGWQVKTAAVKGGRFIDGQMSEPSGIFKDLWELWRHAARLATIATGSSAVFFWSDRNQGKIVTELDDTLNMWLDTSGLPFDGFPSMGRVTFWDPEKLAVRFPDDKMQIYQAAGTWKTIMEQYMLHEDYDEETLQNDYRVPLVQSWKMRYAGGEAEGGIDGKYIAAIPGHCLDGEVKDWEYEEPPCVIFNPMRQLVGKWGRTILQRSMPAIRRYNEILNSCDNSERLTQKRMLFYDPTVTDPSAIKIVHDNAFVPHTGSMQQLPQEMTPLPFNVEAAKFLLDLHKEAAYNLPGLNEAHATMDLGKTMSGVALRLVKNEIYEIFSPLEDEITRCSGPESGKQIIRCAREIQSDGGGFTSTWKGGEDGGWLQEIGAEVFDVLEKHKYRAEAEAVSGTADTPADNAELAKELMETGIITGEAYAQILQTFNVFGHTGNELHQAEQRVVERMIDDWNYAPLEDARERTLDPELWMDRDGMMTLKVAAAYLNARADMIEDMGEKEVQERLQLFKDYLKKLEGNAQKRQELAAQAQAMAQPQQAAPQQMQAPPMAAQ